MAIDTEIHSHTNDSHVVMDLCLRAEIVEMEIGSLS